jgi:hypothetical protein
MKKILAAALLTMTTISGYAQSGTNSPYSQYGLGVQSDQTSGFNRGMNGLGLGFREHNQVNYINPASYSAIDSLSFIFDVGISGQVTNFKEGEQKVNAKNANFEYVIAGFRAFKHLGVSFGVLPFTNIGYNYTSSSDLSSTTSYTNTYSGDGGLHQVFLGSGWEPLKNFSIGVNLGYIWGEINRSVVNSYTDAYINSLSRYYTSNIRSYLLNFGAQYTLPLTKKDAVTLGVTYVLGHKFSGDADLNVISTNSQTGVADTTAFSIGKAYEIPSMYGAGIMYNHNNQLKVGFDYQMQKWSGVDYPTYQVNNHVPSYVLTSGVYKNRQKFTLGGVYCYGENDRHFLRRVQYRFGASYTTPYYYINNMEGPKEYSVSAGFGIPILSNNRPYLNISGQFVHADATGLIRENTFRINIGLTFNENWFMKWKVK